MYWLDYQQKNITIAMKYDNVCTETLLAKASNVEFETKSNRSDEVIENQIMNV